MRPLLFSVATDSYDLAVREIRGEFGGGVRIERVSADLGRIVSGGPSVEELAAACDRGRIIFVRHLTVELASFKPGEVPEAHELAELVLEGLPKHPTGGGGADLDRWGWERAGRSITCSRMRWGLAGSR